MLGEAEGVTERWVVEVVTLVWVAVELSSVTLLLLSEAGGAAGTDADGGGGALLWTGVEAGGTAEVSVAEVRVAGGVAETGGPVGGTPGVSLLTGVDDSGGTAREVTVMDVEVAVGVDGGGAMPVAVEEQARG
jgi:hypothetical protein